MQGYIDEFPTSQDQNKYIQRIMNNSYYGALTTARPLTLIERRYHKFMRSYYNNMRERDLYEATHKYEQIISGCTQNLKFDWGLDMLAKMAYYGIDSNKLMLLQNMRYPRASKRWLWISNYYKMERLFADMDNHSKPNLYAVTYWETLNDYPNYLEGLELHNVSSAPYRYIQALQSWDTMSRIDELILSSYDEYHDEFIKNNKTSNNRSDMKTDWLNRKTK